MGSEMFEHACVVKGCATIVYFDDEPWCSKHALNGITRLSGYSARKAFNLKLDDVQQMNERHKNIFDQEADA